jgi:hypothetical protein
MKQSTPKKLQLTTESLRTLTAAHLDKVAGGIVTSTSNQACTSVSRCGSAYC